MVALSLTISLSRGSDHASASPSLNYQASVYSSHSRSHSQPPPYGYKPSRDNSLEQLVPRHRKQLDFQQRQRARNLRLRIRMASNETGALNIERKKSFGIGGAGNIRRPSDTIYPPRVNADGTRRSSVWSTMSVSPGTSPEGRRSSFMSLFKRNSVHAEDGISEQDDEDRVESKQVNMGRRR
ncbi:hypothetical protein ONS95_014049 [Cadophora gregata]|uniref:uncharacterized protein n=1 Tax=Cadophora gregata TaxID=51156 RepID=UPI0026DA7574|nr:uncharacterized protein ONS95_014049 [Cadophora gregata]KAK0113799.1 hypothetical protein ONS96_014654 [Cadophora gregata f. sp. sojae]KAK0114559.1 hypothetical protein ONS95_014049 [Cadophora gregata]